MGVYIWKERLPSAYQEVEYIESSGTQRIETGVTVNSENRVFKIKYGPLSSGDTLFGTLQLNNTEASVHTRYSRLSNLIEWDCYKGNGYGRVSYSSSQSGIEEMELGNNYIKDIPTGTTLTTGTVGNYSTSDVIPIFCYKVTDGTNQFSYAGFKLYYFQIIDNGTMIRDFVPCYRKSDTEIGLYDLVNDTFYTNSGTGTFTKGADVYMSELKNAYIGEVWTPGANTLAYFPFREDQLDHSGKTGVSLTTSGTKETLGYSFTDNTLITGASQFYWFSCWVKLDSASASGVIGTFTSYNNMGWYIYDSGLYPAITSFYTSSYSRANQRFDNPEQRHLLGVGYDGTNTIYGINGTYGILRNGAGYNFGSGVDLFTKGGNATGKVTYSDFIAESVCWTADEYINYYNQTKANYGL